MPALDHRESSAAPSSGRTKIVQIQLGFPVRGGVSQVGDRVEITAEAQVARAVAVGEVEPREEGCLVLQGQAEAEELEEGVEGFLGAGAGVGEGEEGGGGGEGSRAS